MNQDQINRSYLLMGVFAGIGFVLMLASCGRF